MAKRQLTKNQTRNIKSLQAKRLRHETSDSHQRQGLVVSHHGKQLMVDETDSPSKSTIRCSYRSNLGRIITGDIVQFVLNDDGSGVISAIEPRQTLLERPDPYGQHKAVAANVDQILIVITPKPEPNQYLIDRYLVAIHQAGITPVLVFNKSDLDTFEDTLSPLITLYQALGYQVIKTNKADTKSIENLGRILSGKTSIFVGQSGVGKSTLINKLIPDLKISTKPLSKTSEEGQHTTRTSSLYYYQHDGQIIDSPGIRDFGVWHLTLDDLKTGFIEFHAFLPCKFNDCSHRKEPQCGVIQAVNDQKIHPIRYDNYLRMYEEILNGIERHTPQNAL